MTASLGNLQVFLLPSLEENVPEVTGEGKLVTTKQRGSTVLDQMPRVVNDPATEPAGYLTLGLAQEKVAKLEQFGYLVTCVAAMSLLEVAVTSVT